MAVVSDTSPLSYLVLIGEVKLLEVLYSEVFVPPAVAEELGYSQGPEPTRQLIGAPPPWLQVKEVPEDTGRGPAFATGEKIWSLDPGERQAIHLAEMTGPTALLIDERDGRRIAKEGNVPVTGTIGVLGEAASEGLIDAQEVADRLRKTSFRASEDLYRWLLDRH